MLDVSKNGRSLIKAFESDKLVGYLCPAGVPTISAGITNDALKMAGASITYLDGTRSTRVMVGRAISQAESDRVYAVCLAAYASRVLALLKGRQANQGEFDAMVSLSWNIGTPSFATSSVLSRFLRGDRAGAAAAFELWNKATVNGKKVVLRGLVRRRRAERLMFEGDPARALAVAYDTHEPMPQKVARPAPPKTMATSKTGNAAVVTGGAGAMVAYEGAKEAVRQAQDVRDSAQSAGELLGMSGTTAILLGLGVLIVALAAFVWWDRRRKLRQELV
jgi:lysozyme